MANPGAHPTPRREREPLRAKRLTPCFQEKPLSTRLREAVPETDTGGLVEDTKALGRTRVKELGKMMP